VVTLTLHPNEAQTLADVLSMVAGCPETTRRKHVQSVANSLRGIGFDFGKVDRKKSGPYVDKRGRRISGDRRGSLAFENSPNRPTPAKHLESY